jgi:hypothetical protein
VSKLRFAVADTRPIPYDKGRMPADFTDAELLAFLDEGLPVERMTAVENALRQSAELRTRTATLQRQRDAAGHSVGEIWRRERLSCPTRHQLGSYLLDALPAELTQYIRFHLETIGCRYCAANLDDLRQSSQRESAEAVERRQRFFQSSAGQMRLLDPDRQGPA